MKDFFLKKMVSLRVKYLACGVFMVILGIFLTAWTPTQIILYDRLFMRKGFLPFTWWQELPDSADVVDFEIYFFNVTNYEAFLNGNDSKLNFEEVGPFVFSDKIVRLWATHNDNDTLTYATKHDLVYEGAKNSLDLDAKLTIPNLPLMTLASMVSEMNMFYKLMFHGIYRSFRPKMFIQTTPRSLLWNYSDPLVDKFKNFLPLVAPIKGEIGVLKLVNSVDVKNVTVLIGPENGHDRFFTMDNYDGSKYLPKYSPECKNTLTNVSESQFPQYLQRTAHLKLFKDNYCRYIDLFYDSDVTKYGIDAYKFEVSKKTFEREVPLENDCYKGNPPLPNGVSDLSPCVYGLPLVLSYPHFLYSGFEQDKISGYQRNASRIPNYVIVEPLSGAPLELALSCQINIHMNDLTGIDDSLKIFRNLFLPVLWVKIHQTLPWYMALLIFSTAKLTPILNVIVCAILIVGGGSLVLVYVKRTREDNQGKSDVEDEKKVTDKLISSFS